MDAIEISRHWARYQPGLFHDVQIETLTPTNMHKEIIYALDVLRLERVVSDGPTASTGRPPASRLALARAFVAKAILNLPTTRALIDRLLVDAVLRRICGFEFRREIPSEGTFSNAFAEFAEDHLPERVHASIVRRTYDDVLVGHISRDATAIEGREKPVLKAKKEEKPCPRRRGRPKRGEEVQEKPPSRIELQMFQPLDEMLRELPTACDAGAKTNAKGFSETWIGFKLHLDVDDRGIPVSCILTSASLHDSQVAIPLESMTAGRVQSLYSVMDKAYDADGIRFFVDAMGKVAIIDRKKPKGQDPIPLDPAQSERYKIRTVVERTNSEIKDNHGGRSVRVRGYQKVLTHLMFGVLAVTASGVLRYFT